MKLWLKDLLTKRIEKTKSERYHPDLERLKQIKDKEKEKHNESRT